MCNFCSENEMVALIITSYYRPVFYSYYLKSDTIRGSYRVRTEFQRRFIFTPIVYNLYIV